MSRASAAVGLSYGAHSNLCVNQIRRNGNEAQKRKYLPKLISGDHVGSLAMSEVGAGSDVMAMKLRADKKGDRYILNGTKFWITNATHADTLIVYARTGEGSRGITAFIIEKDFKGFSIGQKIDKLGMRGSPTAELVFDDCFVPSENLLGEQDRGFYALVKNLQNERLVMGGQAIGEAAKAIEITLDWVAQRKAFGASLWSNPAIRQRLAMRAAQVEAARTLLYNTAWRDTRGQDVNKEVSMLKALCGTLVNEVMYDCVQFHGGMGYMRESAIARMSRDARVQSIGGGATEVMLEEVAKRML
jgi:acyl-CoA dehydrogenase